MVKSTARKILVVEDTSFFARVIMAELNKAGFHDVDVAKTFSQAQSLVNKPDYKPFLALVDLTLPDAPNGEVVDLTVSAGLPTIVFSGRFDEDIRNTILAKGVVDYVLKDAPASLSYLSGLVRRVERNTRTRILVAAGTSAHRQILKDRLSKTCLQVETAATSAQTLEILQDDPSIRMVLLGQNFPDLNGYQTLTKIRKLYGMRELVIIGIAEGPCPELTAQFLKSGANDFLTKSSTPEELALRVAQNLDNLDHIQKLTDLANRDPMTGLFNHRYLHETIKSLHRSLHQSGKSLRYAMIDIDRFKQVNDRHGHGAGDQLITAIAHRINKLIPDGGLAVRIGGDEFCVALPETTEQDAKNFLKKLLASMPITPPENPTLFSNVTISIGLSSGEEDNLAAALRTADQCLYEAKESGRNRIVAANQAAPKHNGHHRLLEPHL
ncbi:diguanylate cyclase domain-containing protein [Flexibacterium corallicola]|uniref:diguanylate cyclase domain-containing protein n=1 Tax=Flexibacterium corallicola TaxID=3037259 RepID=UPI00286F728C|nr:diguanylate cyclase [Pseudovibrio sp. M1P-2-3]